MPAYGFLHFIVNNCGTIIFLPLCFFKMKTMKGINECCGEGRNDYIEQEQYNDEGNKTKSGCRRGKVVHPQLSESTHRWWNLYAITVLILALGATASAAFIGLGISSARKAQSDQFERSAVDLVKKIQTSWDDYITAASMIHARCRSRNFTRSEFREFYEYLVGGGLDFHGAHFIPYVSREERSAVEAESGAYYAKHYPNITYHGFFGLEGGIISYNLSQHEFYYPIHYVEPLQGNEAMVDMDFYSGYWRNHLKFCIDTGLPALTDQYRVPFGEKTISYVGLFHPGINVTTETGRWPRDLASISIGIPDLLKRSTEHQSVSSHVYLYDESDSSGTGPVFLGAVSVTPQKAATADIVELPEIKLSQLHTAEYHFNRKVNVANRIWTVAVISVPGTFQPNLAFVIVGGVVIFLASVCLAVWVPTNALRVARFSQLQAQAEAEKASLILNSVLQSAKAERELNDFMAHEVRNPVAAALSACSLVKREIYKEPPLDNIESKETAREDVQTIENSLRFVNDLLRNMLDMHRAASRQLQVTLTPTDILHDVLEPVQSMLAQRDRNVLVTVECPDSLFVMSDRLRLSQVMMNLGRNSSKFVESGFIRLRAQIVRRDTADIGSPEEWVELSVEDSGSGIPPEKRDLLFNKYQESLDLLSQGTGIGLFLCKNLVELMGGEIFLDKTFSSGIPGCPGTRFVVNLRQSALPVNSNSDDFSYNLAELGHSEKRQADIANDPAVNGSRANLYYGDHAADMLPHISTLPKLPETLSVLFVDDDTILRKLFSRMVKTVAPGWTLREAANGETAIRLTETLQFDLIFMDMYMASVEKQLLGTEAVEVLRNKGIQCIICGLSANDMESKFIEAGADAFAFKPFPCEQKALIMELHRILSTGITK